jgi:hypothetical protein
MRECIVESPNTMMLGMTGMHVGHDGAILSEGECAKFRAIAHSKCLELRSDTDAIYIGWGLIRAIRGTAGQPMWVDPG